MAVHVRHAYISLLSSVKQQRDMITEDDFFHYIDTSVLLENTSLVKLLRNHIREWRIFYILTSEEIDYFTDIKFVLNCT